MNDDELIHSLAALGDLPEAPAAREQALDALHTAVGQGAWRVPASMRWRRRWLAVTIAAAFVAGVVAGGWNAPPGSPLHLVQSTRENVQLALAGSNRTALDLSYAEQRISQARSGDDPSEALREARSFLAQAAGSVPAAGPLAQRYRTDVAEVAALQSGRTATPAPSPEPTDHGEGSRSPQGSGTPEGSGPPEASASAAGGDSGGGHTGGDAGGGHDAGAGGEG